MSWRFLRFPMAAWRSHVADWAVSKTVPLAPSLRIGTEARVRLREHR